MKKANKVKSEDIDGLTLSICKTTHFYDVIIEGDMSVLNYLKIQLNVDSDIQEKGIYGKSILVLDTCDNIMDADYLFKEYKKRI